MRGAIPLYLNYRKGVNDSAAQSDMRNAINVLEQCTNSGGYPTGTFAIRSISGSPRCLAGAKSG